VNGSIALVVKLVQIWPDWNEHVLYHLTLLALLVVATAIYGFLLIIATRRVESWWLNRRSPPTA
jgi:hypothetical protein